MNLPTEYVIQQFYQYAGFPVYKKYANTYNGCCPSCKEGESWGKKKRLYYIIKENYIYCQNCQRGWSTLNWIIKQSGLSIHEILEEAKEFDPDDLIIVNNTEKKEKRNISTLPEDSINLFDPQQVEFYKNNQVVNDVLSLIKHRRLDTAINRPRGLFVSLRDFIHKNRLCIPFYDEDNQISFYQTRAMYPEDEKERPKYLSKLDSAKTVFGIRNIDPDLDNLFILEGPIDAMFIKNGLAVGGISTSELQENKLGKYRMFERIWILDNQMNNSDVKKKINSLIEHGERIFIWPKEFKQFKDLNDICMYSQKDSLNPEFFIKNSYKGMEALLKVSN